MHREKEMRKIRTFRESTNGFNAWAYFWAIINRMKSVFSDFFRSFLIFNWQSYLTLFMIFSHSLALCNGLCLFLSFIHSCSSSLIPAQNDAEILFLCVMQKLLS